MTAKKLPGDSLGYLERDTWSNIPLESWELDAVADMLARTAPATEAEGWMRQRFFDAKTRKDKANFDPPDPLPPIVIVIRDPDAANEYVVLNGEAETYDIDAGGMDLDDRNEFLEWAGGHLQAAQDMEATRPEAADRIRDIVMGYLDWKHEDLGDLDSGQLLALAISEGHI